MNTRRKVLKFKKKKRGTANALRIRMGEQDGIASAIEREFALSVERGLCCGAVTVWHSDGVGGMSRSIDEARRQSTEAVKNDQRREERVVIEIGARDGGI